MRKNNSNQYSERNIKNIIHDELNNAKLEWIPEITESVADKLSEKIIKFKDDIFTMLDKVMGELKAIREEQTIVTGKTSEHSNILEDHETRISKLELTPQVS